MTDWVLCIVIFAMVLFGMDHYERSGYLKGMKETAIALEPLLCGSKTERAQQ